MTEPTDEPPCSCSVVRAGHTVVGSNWSERCRAHGIGTHWFNTHEDANGVTFRVRYEAFRRRLFPGLPADWTAEDDLDDEPSPAAVRLAQTLTDVWFDTEAREHDGYPDVVVDLGEGRAGDLLDVTYDADANLIVLRVEPDA